MCRQVVCSLCRQGTGGRCIIMPGQSGSGKSTLTCWLIRNGFQYLTDEIVFLDSAGEVLPLTGPISLKVGPSHASWLLAGGHGDIICGDEGSMIPHRMLNPHFLPTEPKVTDIIFPQLHSVTPGTCVRRLRSGYCRRGNLRLSPMGGVPHKRLKEFEAKDSRSGTILLKTFVPSTWWLSLYYGADTMLQKPACLAWKHPCHVCWWLRLYRSLSS